MKLHKVTPQKTLIVAATAIRVADLSGSPLVQKPSGLQQRNESLPLSKTAQAVIFLLGTGQTLGSNNDRNTGLVPFRPSRQTLAQINRLRPLPYAFQTKHCTTLSPCSTPVYFYAFFFCFNGLCPLSFWV